MGAKYCVVITELKAVGGVPWTTKTTLIMGRTGAMGNVPGNGMGKMENAPLDIEVKNVNRNCSPYCLTDGQTKRGNYCFFYLLYLEHFNFY